MQAERTLLTVLGAGVRGRDGTDAGVPDLAQKLWDSHSFPTGAKQTLTKESLNEQLT